jgi:hypothetical protein
MSTFVEQSEAATVSGDLSFQDTVTLKGLPYAHCVVRIASTDFGEWVSTDRLPLDDKALDEK